MEYGRHFALSSSFVPDSFQLSQPTEEIRASCGLPRVPARRWPSRRVDAAPALHGQRVRTYLAAGPTAAKRSARWST